MWYLQRRNSRPIGPVPTEEVIDGIKSGDIPRDTMVCGVDSKQWMPLAGVPELAAALEGKAPLPASLDVPDGPIAAEKPRPRIIRKIESMPKPERARAALAVSGAALALSIIAMLVVFVPTASLARLLDSVH